MNLAADEARDAEGVGAGEALAEETRSSIFGGALPCRPPELMSATTANATTAATPKALGRVRNPASIPSAHPWHTSRRPRRSPLDADTRRPTLTRLVDPVRTVRRCPDPGIDASHR